MPAALIHPAVPPPTMTTRNGADPLSSRIASPIDPPGTGANPVRTSQLGADTELVAPIHPRPTRIHVNRPGSRGRRGITEYLLLVLRLGIQQIRHIERQLDMGADRVSDRTVEKARRLLVHR